MSPYFALIIPFLVSLIMYLLFRKKVVWWEVLVPIVACLALIFTYKLCVEKAITNDTEYRGSVIVEARYYEYWESWVHKTCTYTTCSGSGKSRTCVTHTYDCSYCGSHDPYWEVVDNYGNTWTISEQYYLQLMRRWSATPQFHDMDRTIRMHGSCGKDGDMYFIRWDNRIETSESATRTHDYENKVQASHSAFKLPYISKEEAVKLALYDYPELKGYEQEGILGLDSTYSTDSLEYIKRYYRYLNAYCGYKYHARIYTMLFYNQNIDKAMQQRAYWDGGNDNEIGICIGLDHNRKLDWVYVFTWCDNKRIAIEIRENLMETEQFNPIYSAQLVGSAVKGYFKPKNFLDFDYLQIDMPTSAIVILYLLVLCASVGCAYWAVRNDFDPTH